ncbi:hypothetical protein HFN63_33155 [Rhizobium leguminosarum]|uniref:hypothetical protein n=1 Tax=Rhizobium leguminosarum TaxID=384 RepID=UPI001C987336|nr:hypothetical protein [Rhizobium leguminosarum]MBY5774876.1 hypothetical protein [Rhizobium leguminosarum]
MSSKPQKLVSYGRQEAQCVVYFVDSAPSREDVLEWAKPKTVLALICKANATDVRASIDGLQSVIAITPTDDIVHNVDVKPSGSLDKTLPVLLLSIFEREQIYLANSLGVIVPMLIIFRRLFLQDELIQRK